MAVHLKQTHFGYVCVQQEMPVKIEEEAWLLGKGLPLSWGSCGVEGVSAESSGPSQTRPVSDQVEQHDWKRHARQADCTGKPSENPGGGEKQQSREVGGKVEVFVGGQSDCIDRIVGQRGGGRQGGAKQGAAGAEGGSTSVQMCMCACMCLRVHVVWRRRRRNRKGAELDPPEPIPGPSRRGRRGPRRCCPVWWWPRRDISEAERDSGRRTAWPPSDTARNSLHHPTAPGQEERGEDEQWSD